MTPKPWHGPAISGTTARARGSQFIPLSLTAVALMTALSPGFGIGGLLLNLSEAPILLMWLLMRWQRSLALTLLSATLALPIWGLESPFIWLSTYLNTVALISLLVLVPRLVIVRDITVLGFAYWFFVGTPLTFLIFILGVGNLPEAGVATSVRTANGLLSLSLATMIYLGFVTARHRLPQNAFPNPDRLIISLDALGRLLASFLIPIPTVLFFLAASNSLVAERLESAVSIAEHELDQAWHLYHELRHRHLDHKDLSEPEKLTSVALQSSIIQTLNDALNASIHSAHQQGPDQQGPNQQDSNQQNPTEANEFIPFYIDLAPDCSINPDNKRAAFTLPRDAHIVLTDAKKAVWIPASAAPNGVISDSPVMRARHELVTIPHHSVAPNGHFSEGQCLRITYKVWDVVEHRLFTMMWWMWAVTGLLLLLELFVWWFVQLFSAPLKEIAEAMGHFSARQAAGESSQFQFKNPSRLEELDTLITGFKEMEAHIGGLSQNLRTLNSNYESLLDQTAVGFAAIDQLGGIAYCNGSMKALIERVPELLEQIEDLHAGSEFEIRSLTIKLTRSQIDLLTGVIDRFDASGQIDGFWVVATDVTTLRSTEAQLIQSQKMATLGEMATGVAHEINQPLQAIRLALANIARQLDKQQPDLERVKGKIDSSVEQVYRVAELVKHMKTFGRTAGTDQAPFLPDAAIQTLTAAWRENYSSAGLSITLNLMAGESARVLGNRNQFEQVIINLLQNARDEAEQHQKPAHVTLSSTATSSYYQLKVIDQSGGIPDDVIDNIFTPFFTTKDPDKGTGIGLSISYTIIRDMAGTITVANVGDQDQRGARFTITIPLTHVQPDILE